MDIHVDVNDDSALFKFDEDIFITLADSGSDLFALIADTGIHFESVKKEKIIELLTLSLQVNFITVLSSCISVALSDKNIFVITYSDYASRINGRELFEIIETVLDKTKTLKKIIVDIGSEEVENKQKQEDLKKRFDRFV
jgi:hypothetical protein